MENPRGQNPESPRRVTGRIDTISGGLAGGGDISNSRKQYARDKFTGHSVYPLGIADLDLMVGKAPRKVTIRASFTVVDISDPSYNGLIGRPILNALRAIISALHLKMKFPTTGGVGQESGDKKRASVCYQLSVPRGGSLRESPEQKRQKRDKQKIMSTIQSLMIMDNST
ncbi:hypothetical protein LIER_42785 [Lithospermum erythrorhizon]|uniref:Uncharacterized protein n=1 Tax=Lithospermum erythrorhizon TaxID=34254 RepID=A0AAV3NYU1_LITER